MLVIPANNPPGFGDPNFKTAYARAQTWIEFRLAGAKRSLLTKVLFSFDPMAIQIAEWMMDQISQGPNNLSSNHH